MDEYKFPPVILPKIRGFNWFPDEEVPIDAEFHNQLDRSMIIGMIVTCLEYGDTDYD
jgi:hypothetical protein